MSSIFELQPRVVRLLDQYPKWKDAPPPRVESTHCRHGHPRALYTGTRANGRKHCTLCYEIQRQARIDAQVAAGTRKRFVPKPPKPPKPKVDPNYCRNGHLRSEHMRVQSDGARFCSECKRVAARRRLAESKKAQPSDIVAVDT